MRDAVRVPAALDELRHDHRFIECFTHKTTSLWFRSPRYEGKHITTDQLATDGLKIE